jgi:Predicted nucleic acid-binding protein, contains PIN domain
VILDTNALSALLDKDSALLEVIRESHELALPVIVLGEFRFGIAISKRRHQYETWLARDLTLFRVLPVIEQTSVYYAAIRTELKASGSVGHLPDLKPDQPRGQRSNHELRKFSRAN